MAKEILMPALSPSMTEGTLVKWFKKEGDEVKSGEMIAEVETDKAVLEMEAFDSGVMKKILCGPGSKVAVNTVMAVLGSKDEVIDFTRKYLTNYKIPRSVEFRESLPKTNVGKILRRELRNK